MNAADVNLYLVGFMGTGKTTVGRAVAQRLRFACVDSDHEIERVAGRTIPEIFATEGEPAFRRMEREFVEHGHPASRAVVACGGGLVIQPGLREELRRRGVVICLHASLETILERAARQNNRPLLNVPDPAERLRTLYAEREAIYRSAGTLILTDFRPLREVTTHVIRIWRREAGRVCAVPLTMDERPELLRRRIAELGFDEVRFAALAAAPAQGLRDWLAAGHHADMTWMERTAEKRATPELVLPGARSIILLGINYWDAEAENPAGRPLFARYSRYADYHDTVKPALVRAGRLLEEIYGVGGGDYRYYVDTGPVLERGWAARSGLGFIGKNAMLISRRHGNWLFLATVLSRVELPADPPIKVRGQAEFGDLGRPAAEVTKLRLTPSLCGKCTRCLDACPTQAFAAPGVVDARRCISYQTIENRGIIPRELRAGIGARIYGCDICLEVCPWNRFARSGRRLLLAARPAMAALTWRELLELTPERFAELFRRTPVQRLKYAGLLRNACLGAGNSGDPELVGPLVRLASHAFPLVRVHAVWAVRRLAGRPRAEELLGPARAAETDAAVLAEYAAT